MRIYNHPKGYAVNLYTIEMEVIRKNRIAAAYRRLRDRLGLKINVRTVNYEGQSGSDSALPVLQAAIAYCERKNLHIVRVSRVIKGGGFS